MENCYRVLHILLPDADDAMEIRHMIVNGEDFKELAKEYSECESALKGGDLGLVQFGQMEAEFEKAVSKLSPGEISSPVETKYGFHIIKRIK